jgi:hypothetical protein
MLGPFRLRPGACLQPEPISFSSNSSLGTLNTKANHKKSGEREVRLALHIMSIALVEACRDL